LNKFQLDNQLISNQAFDLSLLLCK